MTSLLELLLRLFGRGTSTGVPAGVSPLPVNSTTEPLRIVTSRVLLVIYDPVVDSFTGQKLSQFMNWKQPDALANEFIRDILEVSQGLARFQIVQRLELNEFPALADGFRYKPDEYIDVVKNGRPPHMPQLADYQGVITGLNVLPRVASHAIDEVWLMCFPQAGFYESSMCGKGAFWCNSSPQAWSGSCSRRFVVMGFSFERGVGEMLHSFGHRAESILVKTFEKLQGEDNLYSRFSRYDKTTPGDAEVGNIHFPPNSDHDYDYNNPRRVASNCRDWLNFPSFRHEIQLVNADEWGNGDLRLHHKWWLDHLPKVAGRMHGIANNWWQYIMDPNMVSV
jgi:hypothetical protein